MENILELLKQVEECDEIVETESGYLTDGYADDWHPLIQQVVNACDDHCSTYALLSLFLMRNGYHNYCGERDSFGPLSWCIDTKKGIIVFG